MTESYKNLSDKITLEDITPRIWWDIKNSVTSSSWRSPGWYWNLKVPGYETHIYYDYNLIEMGFTKEDLMMLKLKFGRTCPGNKPDE